MGEGIDRLVSAEVTGRGVIGEIHAAARARQDGPLCLEAAVRILEHAGRGDVVILATGFPIPPWFAGEQDGPVGAATLARAMVLGAGVRPVIVTDPQNVEICAAACHGAGLYTRPLEQARDLPTTAAVLPFPLDWDEATRCAQEMLDALHPAALIAIERPGANEHRQYHAARGASVTPHCAKVDVLVSAARAAGTLTIAIADGGNDLGCALVRDAVLRVVPGARMCACPCGGTIVPIVEPDLLVPGVVSNWAAYGIEAAMALLLGRPEVLHGRDVDARAQELCTAAGANNAGPGLLDVGADAVPGYLHGHIVDLLGQLVRGGLDFRRMYRGYPWL
jgi:D-glutamate cyclase